MTNGNKINYSAYCKAFEAIDQDVAEKICYSLDKTDGHWTPSMYQDKKGDGFVLVPSYGTISGEEQILGWRRLSQNGDIELVTSNKNGEYETSIDEDFAGYFIAGAFGASEIDGGYTLDTQLVEGLQKLYKVCLQNNETCLNSAEAKRVGERWEILKEEKAAAIKMTGELIRLRDETANLRARLDKELEKAEHRSDLNAKLAQYEQSLPANPRTLKDFQRTIELLQKMIDLAKTHMAEERRQTLIQMRKKQEEEAQQSIPYLITESERLEQEVYKEESFWRTRFTDALKAGLECMPIAGNTIEERYCAAKNRFDLVTWLLDQVKYFNENGCAHFETKEVDCVEEFDLEKKRKQNPYFSDDCYLGKKTVKYCAEMKHDNSSFESENLMERAKGYCDTTCNFDGELTANLTKRERTILQNCSGTPNKELCMEYTDQCLDQYEKDPNSKTFQITKTDGSKTTQFQGFSNCRRFALLFSQ